jgi:protein TonB
VQAAPEKAQPKIIRLGIVNAKAKKFPQPKYPATAKAAGISGEVKVRVTVEPTGKVVKAEAVSGHELLLPSAIEAARQAEFYSFPADGPPLYVEGILVYQFRLRKRR